MAGLQLIWSPLKIEAGLWILLWVVVVLLLSTPPSFADHSIPAL